MNKMAAIFVFFFISLCFIDVECSILCQRGFCADLILKTPCGPTVSDCDINNATMSGLRLPSPTICNCCDYCLPMYNLNSPCSVGGPGAGTTIGRCGHGLTCDNVRRLCVRMKTKCHDAQDDYDIRHSRAQTGMMETRPECDDKGNFASFTCIPSQTCFCQSEDGERLFGEMTYTGIFHKMPCECSRMVYLINKSIGTHVPYPVRSLRCTSDGNFNPVQCITNICVCVNKLTGKIIGTETIDLNEKPISDLPCYEKDLDLFPQKNATKRPFEYTSPCYESVIEKENMIEKSIKDGYNVDFFSSFAHMTCLPDGTFGRMTISSSGSKVCISERGTRIGKFEAKPDTPEFNEMDCKCALTTALMLSSSELPRCCSNGNFRPIQCRRGLCYCVDSDGRQLGLQNSDVTKLKCYTNENWRKC